MKHYWILALIALAYCEDKTVVIIGTNDIHGTAFPTQYFNQLTNSTYNFGGLVYMAQMFNTIRNIPQYTGNVLYLDGGDQFQGGIQSSSLVSSGQIMNDFYNAVGVDGSSIGNHQFDFGPTFLNNYLNGRDQSSPHLAANLKSQTGEINFLPRQKQSQLYTLQNGLKIGVIGLSTIQTPKTTSTFNDGTFPAFRFEQYSPIVLAKSQQLREKGANAVLIVSHVGNRCSQNQTYGIWTPETEQEPCAQDDEMSLLIKSLPAGTIDGVVQGHRHTFSHHFIAGVPVMGTIKGGYYFNIMYLKFNDNTIVDKRMEGPIPVCQKIFENVKQCNYMTKDKLQNAGNLVPWKFKDVTVEAQKKLNQVFNRKWLPKMQPFLVPLVNSDLTMTRLFAQVPEYDLGNLITSLMNSAAPGHDFVIMNSGGFRTTWVPGIIQQQHFFSMFPFDNDYYSFQFTGKELLDTLALVQVGRRAYYPTYGLKQLISVSKNGQKKLESACFADGREIVPQKTYRGLSIRFLIQGGDDFKEARDKTYTIKNQQILGQFRSLTRPQLLKIDTIRAGVYVDPKNPRLKIIDPQAQDFQQVKQCFCKCTKEAQTSKSQQNGIIRLIEYNEKDLEKLKPQDSLRIKVFDATTGIPNIIERAQLIRKKYLQKLKHHD